MQKPCRRIEGLVGSCLLPPLSASAQLWARMSLRSRDLFKQRFARWCHNITAEPGDNGVRAGAGLDGSLRSPCGWRFRLWIFQAVAGVRADLGCGNARSLSQIAHASCTRH